MSVLKRVGIVLGVLVALLLGVGALLPKAYEVERHALMQATPQTIYAQINSFKNWEAWSPWLAKDPSITNTYAGPDAGVGAKVSWTSEESGQGSQEIIANETGKLVRTQLDFGDMGSAVATFKLVAQGEGTQVSWSLSGENAGPIGSYFSLLMDSLVGADYEDGLARLKKHVEQ